MGPELEGAWGFSGLECVTGMKRDETKIFEGLLATHREARG